MLATGVRCINAQKQRNVHNRANTHSDNTTCAMAPTHSKQCDTRNSANTYSSDTTSATTRLSAWLHSCMAAWLHTSVNHKSKCPFHKLFIVRDKNNNAQYSTNPPPKCKEKVRSSATALPFNFLIHNSLAFELFKQFRTRQNWHETSLIILSIARNNCINSKG